jgi:hypothetical protein
MEALRLLSLVQAPVAAGDHGPLLQVQALVDDLVGPVRLGTAENQGSVLDHAEALSLAASCQAPNSEDQRAASPIRGKGRREGQLGAEKLIETENLQFIRCSPS